MKLLLLYRRRWWLFYVPVLLCAMTALWWSTVQWKLLPPDRLIIAAGSLQGSYSPLARRYAERLERIGLKVDIVYSDQQKGSLERLLDASDAASLGFANGLYARSARQVQSLAVIGQEPVWVFAPIAGPRSLAQATGLRVAAGQLSSASHLAAELLLAHAGIRSGDTTLETLSGMAAADALIDGKLDLVIMAAGEDSQAVQLLARQGNLQILGTDNAGALAVQAPYLQPLLLPQGSIELRGDVPPRDLTLMSLQTHLLIKPGMHPALQRALLDAAVEIHEMPSFLQRHGQFPAYRGSDFVVSPTARAYEMGARPWLESLLPYRTAQRAELFLYAVLPILCIAVLFLMWIPKVFDWRINAALNHFYGDVKFLESDMEKFATDKPMAMRGLLEQLDGIERQVVTLDMPDEYSERWYTLREHLALARERLLKLRSR